MKKNFIVLLVLIIPMLAFSVNAEIISGKIILKHIDGAGNFYYIEDSQTKKDIFLCGISDIASDNSLKWVEQAEESGAEVKLQGTLIKESDGGLSFQDGKFINIANNNPPTNTAPNLYLEWKPTKLYGYPVMQFTIQNRGDNPITITGVRLNRGNVLSVEEALLKQNNKKYEPFVLKFGQKGVLCNVEGPDRNSILEVEVFTNHGSVFFKTN